MEGTTMTRNEVYGCAEVALGVAIIIISFISVVIFGELSQDWFQRLFEWVPMITAISFAKSGLDRLNKSSVSPETKTGEEN